MNYFVADPDWGFWIIAYFYLGGIAAGSYFLAVLIEWFGSEEDQPLARTGYYLAFPLVLLCTIFLIVDLNRPERFWHMLLKSETVKAAFDAGFPLSLDGWRLALSSPAIKYWSPMSLGAWVLLVFGACSFASFVTTVWPKRGPGKWLRSAWPHGVLQVMGCVSGFFIAAYTGALLSATNQPMWSDTTWLAALFLASAASTSLAAMNLIAWRWKLGSEAARRRLADAEPLALGLELVVLAAFLASLGANLAAVMHTVRGNVLIFGTVAVGVLLPLLLHALVGDRRRWRLPATAAVVLLGGLLLRYGVLTTPGELLARGPDRAASFGPEAVRRVGQPGADVLNRRGTEVQPRSKLIDREKQ